VVGPLRDDGKHEVLTVLQRIDLVDRIQLAEAAELELEGFAGDTLVGAALRELAQSAEVEPTWRVRIEKRIPVAAGLGGGSSDAAATLRGLRRLWRLDLDDAALAEIASGLGADVPFLLRGGTAFAGGVGDRLEPLPDLTPTWVLLYTPPYRVAEKTIRAYRALGPGDWSDGTAAAAAAAAVRTGRRPDLDRAPNAFERVADELFPGLAEHRARLSAAGAPWVRLSGAGPTLFTLTARRRTAEAIRKLLGSDPPVRVVPTVGAGQN